MATDYFQMYLGGKWVDAEGGKTFEVRNPADQTVAGLVAAGGAAETRRAIEAAHRAFPVWSRVPARDRGIILKRIMDLMAQRRDEIARLVVPRTASLPRRPRARWGFPWATSAGSPRRPGAPTATWSPRPSPPSNAPFIVFDDADFDKALDGAVAMKFLRAGGQSCIRANRIFVQETIAERFIPAFVEKTKALKVGPLTNEEAGRNM